MFDVLGRWCISDPPGSPRSSVDRAEDHVRPLADPLDHPLELGASARCRQQGQQTAVASASCPAVLCPAVRTGVPSLATGLWIASTGTTSHLLALDCAGAQCGGRSNGSPWRGASSDGPSTSRADVSSGRPAVAGTRLCADRANRRGRCEGILTAPARSPLAPPRCAPRSLPKALTPALSRHSILDAVPKHCILTSIRATSVWADVPIERGSGRSRCTGLCR